MAIERPILDIPSVDINEQSEYFERDSKYIFNEALTNHKKLAKTWKLFARDHGPEYLSSAIFSYGLVIDQLDQDNQEFTFGKEELIAHRKGRIDLVSSIKDEHLIPYKWEKMLRDADFKTPFADFLTNLYNSSPDYFEYIEKRMYKTPTNNVKKEILLGVYDGYMPFYGKIEAAQLQDLWNIPTSIDESHKEWMESTDVVPTLTPQDLERIYSLDSIFPQQEGLNEK